MIKRHVFVICRTSFVGVATLAPLVLSTRPSVLVLAVLGSLLLLLGPDGGATLAGGLCVVAEVALAVGQADTARALVTGGVVGAAIVAFSAVTSPMLSAPLGRGPLARELVIGSALAVLAALAPGAGTAAIVAGLVSAALLIAAVAAVSNQPLSQRWRPQPASALDGSDRPSHRSGSHEGRARD